MPSALYEATNRPRFFGNTLKNHGGRPQSRRTFYGAAIARRSRCRWRWGLAHGCSNHSLLKRVWLLYKHTVSEDESSVKQALLFPRGDL